ncbi:MAG: hypothetical protein ACLU9S_00530 [Oscillospiraceae bacterium]
MHGLIRSASSLFRGPPDPASEQLEEEFKGRLELAKYCLETVGMLEDCTFRFSQWDPNNKEKHIGTPSSGRRPRASWAKSWMISR